MDTLISIYLLGHKARCCLVQFFKSLKKDKFLSVSLNCMLNAIIKKL